MWKILGKDAIYIDIPETWKARMLELAGDDEKSQKFKEIVSVSEVTYLMNGSTEEHTFFIRLDKAVTPEEIQILADVALDILKATEDPCISIEDQVQRYQVVITNWEEPEIIGLNKTPGMSSGQVFLPIIKGMDAPGRANSSMQDQFFRTCTGSKHDAGSLLGVPGGASDRDGTSPPRLEHMPEGMNSLLALWIALTVVLSR
jgi:hypothetical protein